MSTNEDSKKHIQIYEKEKCCGCNACMNICKQGCITMEPDEEGFFYPHINQELCIECRLCVSRCHMINERPNRNKKKPDCYAAYNKDSKKMMDGSSGGIFEAMCEAVCHMKGIIYGAALVHGLQVKHQRASNLEETKKFRKSKYLQSDIGYTYSMAKKDLEEGRMVLFSGTPCQIGGLYGYLEKDYENLYTVDLVCHGVPSEKVFNKYLEALENKYKSKPISICWRDKREGWGPNKVSIQFENGQEIISPSSYNSMQFGFLNNLYLRPSCYECKYADIPRVADISLGDFWGYDGDLMLQNHNKGISMIAISNVKGKFLFEKICSKLQLEQVDIEYCKAKSVHFSKAPNRNRNRSDFMKEFREGKDFDVLIREYLYGKHILKEFDLFDLKKFISETDSKGLNKIYLSLCSQSVGKTIYKQV